MATTETFKQDALAGLEYLRSLGKFSKIGLAGHSEGGTIAFLLAGEGKTDFIISLAGTSVDGTTVLVEQTRKILKGSGMQEDMVRDYCRAVEKVYNDSGLTAEDLDMAAASLPESMRQNLHEIMKQKETNPWIRYFISLDPTDAVKNIGCPVFALNGEKDVQVIADSNIPHLEEHLKDNAKNKIKIYPDLNHMFQHCKSGMTDEYAKIEETMSEEVLTDIIDWIKSLD